MKARKLISMGLLALLCSSCIVSQRKYNLLDEERIAAEASRDSLSKLLNSVRTDFTTLQGEQAMLNNKYSALNKSQESLQATLEALKKDTATLGAQIRSYAQRLDVNKSKNATLNEKLQKQLEELEANKGQNATLSEQLQKQMAELEANKAALEANKAENAKLSAELDKRQKELTEREQTIEKLQGVINEQNARVKSILDNVKSALTGFNSDQLTVREESGKVYVAMSEKLLFPSGKATVNEQGKKALGLLAEVLNKQTDIDVTIEGHTDSQPIKTAQFSDNWDLSVVRATSVVRILTQTYRVNPLQILPCGRGEFKPIDTNETKEGRARNRRTEIIISPKLDKLYNIITAQ